MRLEPSWFGRRATREHEFPPRQMPECRTKPEDSTSAWWNCVRGEYYVPTRSWPSATGRLHMQRFASASAGGLGWPDHGASPVSCASLDDEAVRGHVASP